VTGISTFQCLEFVDVTHEKFVNMKSAPPEVLRAMVRSFHISCIL
jgi:hypothetical protein